MKICFLARPIYDDYSSAIFKKLREKNLNYKGCFLVMDEEEEKKIKNRFPNSNVYNFSKFYRDHEEECTLNNLISFEKKYECEPIWKYIYTDRFLINTSYDYAVKTTVAMFLYFEEIFEKEKPDFYFSETIATLFCYIAYIVGKKSGTKYITLFGARGIFSKYHYISGDPYQGVVGFEKDYQTIQYSDKEKEWAKNFLIDFEKNYVPPEYMKKAGEPPHLKAKYIKLIFVRLFGRFNLKFNNKYSYMYYKANKRATDPILYYFRYQSSKKYYHQPNLKERYVLFPLHFQPEASTIVCAEKYEKQLFFIDGWAKSLPADTVLYVKEHYAFLGHRDINFYKELLKYPNVRLISPWFDTQILIKNAQAVTTLTGTAGWEAMLLKKPVFIGGNIFFDNAPGVIKIFDIYNNYMQEIKRWKEPSDEELIQYLCAYKRAIYRGDSSGSNLNDENIELISSSLINGMDIINTQND